MTFGMEKLEWCGYPMMINFEDIFIHFYRVQSTNVTDRQTDGHRMTAQATLMLLCIMLVKITRQHRCARRVTKILFVAIGLTQVRL